MLDGSPAACSVTYTPSDVSDGAHLIVARVADLDSSGNFSIAVTGNPSQTIKTTTEILTITTSGTASIWTDKEDYPPDGIPMVYGAGFTPNSNITVTVTRPDTETNTWFLISDDSGSFTITYALDGISLSDGTYTVTATDGTNTATTTFTDASTKYALSVTVTNNGGGSVTSNTGGINCPTAKCSANYNNGTQVTLTATADTGGLTAWSGSCAGVTGNTCTLTMDSAKSVTVTFSFSLTVTKSGTGSGTVSSNPSGIDCGSACSASYPYGTFVTLTATPAGGSAFSNWGGACSGETCGVTINAPRSVTATFNLADTTPPVITKTVTGTSGANGWYTSDVIIAWTVTDPESSVVIDSGCGTQTFTTETVSAASSCSAHSAGGSSSDSVNLKLDKTGPSASLSVTTGAAGSNGWYTSDVTVSTSGSDSISGPVSCTADQSLTTETTGTVFNGACTNDAGLSTDAAALTVKLDKTGPSASLSVIAGTLGLNGWYTSDVTIHTGGADVISDSVTCTADQSQTTETAGQIFNGQCTNGAGLSTPAAPLAVKLDKTAPLITVTGTNAITIEVYSSYTDTGATVTDNLDSSVTVISSGSVDSDLVGDYTIYYDAVDAAGNHAVQKSRTVHVTPRAITVTADSQTRVYGEFDPGLTYKITSGSLHEGDFFTGALTRDAGEDVGTYAITQGTLALNSNYDLTFVGADLTITKASAVISVSGYTGVYDGNAHGASGTATGVKGEDLSSSLDLGSTFTNVPGDTAHWTFSGGTNYNDASGDVAIEISKADAAIVVTPYSVTYDGDPHTATGTATGAKGESLSGLDLTGTTHTDAGDYPTDAWAFTDVTGNYNNAAGTVHDSITKADATIVITPYDVTYDGNPHTATGTATGVKGESLSGPDLSGTTHTNAGDYAADAWAFADVTGNYNDASGTVSDKISKADAIITVNGYTGVYDGDAHGASGPATGVKGEDLSSSLNLGDSFTNVPGGTAHWTFTGGTNYNDASGDVSILISKADATIVVTPYDVTYDGNAHTATGSATGVKGEALSGLDLSGTTHTIAGDYPTDAWTFTGGTNYNDASGTVSDKISKADATIVVTPYDVPYDGNAHTATGSAKGVKGESLTGLVLTGTTHTIAGDYQTDAWTFTDATGNYNDDSGTVRDVIRRKALTITANSDSKTFGETYTFAGTEFTTLGLVNPPDTVTSVTLASDGTVATATVGSYDIVASDAVGTGLSNYDITYDKGTLTVDQRPTIATIAPASAQYSDPITLTATVSPITSGDQKLAGSVEFFISGVSVGSQLIDESGVAKLSGIPNSRAAGSYDARAVFTSENSNFAGSEGTGTLSVTKESTGIEYTGDTAVFTAGPTINNAPIRLSAKLTQEADYYPGDLTLAKVTFELTPAGGGSTITVANIPVSAAGDALTTASVPVGDYSVKVTISVGNMYWTQDPYGDGILDVVLGSNEQRVTGGGWIPDSKSANGKDNFGFTVNYNKNGAPKGNFLFMFRGTDGYNYQVKSKSWAKGGLSFTSTNTAYFTAKATLSKIDRATGQVISSDGSYTFAVNILDGDLMNPRTTDTFAVTIFDSTGNIWMQLGTGPGQITLGGGNIVVHSK